MSPSNRIAPLGYSCNRLGNPRHFKTNSAISEGVRDQFMTTNTKPTLSLVELVQTPAWARLSPQQAFFLKEYLAEGLAQGAYDPFAAAQKAYPAVKHTKVWVARLKSNPRIKAVLHLYFGDPEAKSLADEVRSLVKRLKRRGANFDRVYEPLVRCAVALEQIAAKGNSDPRLHSNLTDANGGLQ
jgi:hypothetical protein